MWASRDMVCTHAYIDLSVVWSCTCRVAVHEWWRIKTILDSFDQSVNVDDESLIDISTYASGSRPVYVFMLMKAMGDASGE